MKKNKFCHFCKKEINGNLGDNYNSVKFICKDCLKEKPEDWKQDKINWIESDFGNE